MGANSDFTELASVTLNKYAPKIADNVTKHIPLLFRLQQKGNVKTVDGGDKILQNLDIAENATFGWYSGSELLNTGASEVLSAANFDWKQAYVNIVFNGLEKLKNAGRAKMFDLIEARIQNAERTIKNGVAASLFLSNTENNGKSIGGLQHLVADTPTSGTCGGIDRSVTTAWRNKSWSFTGNSVTASSTTIIPAMNWLYRQTTRNNDNVDFWVAGDTYFGYFETAMQAIQRFVSAEKANGGFSSYSYKGGDVFYDPSCNAARMYALNTDYLFLRPSSERNFTPDDRKAPVNQDAFVQPIYFAGNMTMSNAASQGVILA